MSDEVLSEGAPGDGPVPPRVAEPREHPRHRGAARDAQGDHVLAAERAAARLEPGEPRDDRADRRRPPARGRGIEPEPGELHRRTPPGPPPPPARAPPPGGRGGG